MKSADELRGQLASLTDNQLLAIVQDSMTNRPQAIHLAHQELMRRGIVAPMRFQLTTRRLVAVGLLFVAVVIAFSALRSAPDTFFLASAPVSWFLVWLDRARFARWSRLTAFGKLNEFRLFFAALFCTVLAALVLLGKL